MLTDTPLSVADGLVERMEVLVRGMVRPETQNWSGDYVEARAIVALLPKPVDPDLLIAREMAVESLRTAMTNGSFTTYVMTDDGAQISGTTAISAIMYGLADSSVGVSGRLAAIKKGRSLARAEVQA